MKYSVRFNLRGKGDGDPRAYIIVRVSWAGRPMTRERADSDGGGIYDKSNI